RVQRALGQKVDVAELARLLGKDADELVANEAALFLRVGNARQASEERIRGVDVDQSHAQVPLESLDDSPRFAAAQQTVVDKDARQLVANGAMYQHGNHRRIHAAREGADHPARADLPPYVLNGL